MKWIELSDDEGQISWLSINHIVRVKHNAAEGYFQIRASDGETYFIRCTDTDAGSAKATLKQLLAGDWDSSE